MLKLKISITHEDKFGLLLSYLKSKGMSIDVENLDIVDNNFIFFLLDYPHPKTINRIFTNLIEVSEIIGFPIEWAFVYTKEDAYTDGDKYSSCRLPYFSLNKFGNVPYRETCEW